jgi:hypothetical protein
MYIMYVLYFVMYVYIILMCQQKYYVYIMYVCILHNQTTVNITYIIRKHTICACVSGIILYPDFCAFHEFLHTMLMFELCHNVYHVCYVYYAYCVSCVLCVLCTLFYILCAHNAHNYIKCLCMTYE